MGKTLDLKGLKFGRLTVVERATKENARNAMWFCLCECGGSIVAAAANIGKTTLSCGCLKKETARQTLIDGQYSLTHGLSQSAEWRIWSKMKTRCYNPKTERYPRYGGRGIKVCDRWLNNFEYFYADMGPRPSPKHSIERINNDRDYEPDNCKWATVKEQGRNTTTNNWITINGVRKCLLDWCIFLNVPKWKPYDLCRSTLADRTGPPRFTSPEAAVRHLYAIRFGEG